MPNLAILLLLPWFAILGALFWFFPRTPRDRPRRIFDVIALTLALSAAFVGMRWAYANADLAVGAMWRQILASLVAYGLFLLVLAIALPLRTRLLRKT
jgi:hypothetical protein